MRSTVKFLLAIGFGVITGLSSCVDGSDSIGGGSGGGNGNGGGSDSSNPKITIQSQPDKFVRAGDSLSYQLLLQSNSQLTSLKEVRFELQRLVDGSYKVLPDFTSVIDKSGIPSTGQRFGFVIKNTFESGDTLRAKFMLENTNGSSTTKTRMLIVSEFMDDRVISSAEDSTIIIQHRFIDNPNEPKNEFSLYYTANLYQMGYVTSGQGQEADIADYSSDTSTFDRRWRSKTQTRFVKANDANLDFTYPLDVKVEAAYKARTPTDVIENISEGDLYIANVRQTGRYLVIKITEIFDQPEDPTARYIQFKATGKDLFP